MRLLICSLSLIGAVFADGEPARTEIARTELVRTGLQAQDRASREKAAAIAREWARTDPAGVDSLYAKLDLRGKAGLVRALAGTGTRHGALLALTHAADSPDAVFRALIAGLQDGGETAILTAAPKELVLPPIRTKALAELSMRYRVEKELAALKSQSGRTGHFTGQYARMLPLRPGAIEVMWQILRDRSWPLPGDASSDRYEPIHEGMLAFDRDERRTLAAYSFAELLTKGDTVWQFRLEQLFYSYFYLDQEDHPLETEDLAPAIAYSLHDLGLTHPADKYIQRLLFRATRYRGRQKGRRAMWDLGYAYMRIGKPKEGRKWYESVIELQNNHSRGVACYNLACFYALLVAREPKRADDHRELAFFWLGRAIRTNNFIDWVWMDEDGDLNAIRKDPEYVRLRDGLKKRYPMPKRRKRVEKDPAKFLVPK